MLLKKCQPLAMFNCRSPYRRGRYQQHAEAGWTARLATTLSRTSTAKRCFTRTRRSPEEGTAHRRASSGVRVKDRQGRDLIDAGAGLWCVNIGYGRQEMADAAKKAIETLAYSHIFAGTSNEPIIRLAERVLGLLHEDRKSTRLNSSH